MSTFPEITLHSERLLLRPFSEADVSDVELACSDPQSQRWLPLPNPYTEKEARTWCTVAAHEMRTSGAGLQFATVETGIGRLAGCFGLVHTDWRDLVTEIGYWVAPWSRGRGIATEATSLLSRWALTDGGMHRVELRAAPANLASNRVAQKAGFTREGSARSAGITHTGRTDLVIWSLLPGDIE